MQEQLFDTGDAPQVPEQFPASPTPEKPLDWFMPTPEELERINELKDQIGEVYAQNSVLKSRAGAYRAWLAEQSAATETAQRPEAGVAAEPPVDMDKLVALSKAAMQSNTGVKEYLLAQPESPERNKLLNGMDDGTQQAA